MATLRTRPERGTLTRLLRGAELAGHHVDAVLSRAIEGRGFDGARSIAAVLHGRVQRIVGTAEPVPTGGYAGRTPALKDPVADWFACGLAAAMDERVSLLAIRAAMDRPVWALVHLGEVPADPVDQADWLRRAGVVAAYREERGYAHETDPIGPAPERTSPEQRASWQAAYTALRMPEEHRELASMGDGELWARRETYARDAAWAPPYVANELRAAHLAEDTYRAEAVRAWHRADAETGVIARARAQRLAEHYSALAQDVGAYREALTEVAGARRRWHAATEQSRQQALAGDAELRRRHPDTELPPLHLADELSHAEPETEIGQPGGGPGPSARPDPARIDVETALTAARNAERILAERERQADRDADRSDDDLIRRREAQAEEEAAARRGAVRQDPALSRMPSLEMDELELEAGQ